MQSLKSGSSFPALSVRFALNCGIDGDVFFLSLRDVLAFGDPSADIYLFFLKDPPLMSDNV